jgi:hypothetical protein
MLTQKVGQRARTILGGFLRGSFNRHRIILGDSENRQNYFRELKLFFYILKNY